jgi:SM-20-related protein
MNKEIYPKIIDALVTDGYIVIKDAIDKKLCSDLLKDAKSESSFKNAGISSTNDLHIDSTKRRDKTLWLDEDEACRSEYLTFSRELSQNLNKELYLGISYYEAHYALYEEGDFYEKHLDSFRGSKNRVVTTVLYLNEEWSDKDGGELVIYNEDDKEITKVTPNAGTLVLFLSDKFPHEVLVAKNKRYSIAGWFRVDR